MGSGENFLAEAYKKKNGEICLGCGCGLGLEEEEGEKKTAADL